MYASSMCIYIYNIYIYTYVIDIYRCIYVYMYTEVSVNSYYAVGRRQAGEYRLLYVCTIAEYMDGKIGEYRII